MNLKGTGRSNCNLIKDFVRNVVCDGKAKNYLYLLQWMSAHLYRPERATQIMPILIGNQGAGKSTFGKLIIRLTGPEYCIDNANIKDMLKAEYQQELYKKSFVNFEEGSIEGGKQYEKMKNWITSDVVRIKTRGSLYVETPAHVNTLFSTNIRLPVTDTDSMRRFLILYINNKHCNSSVYFLPLYRAFADDRAILELKKELFDIYKKYGIKDKIFNTATDRAGNTSEVRLQSMGSVYLWLRDLLADGMLNISMMGVRNISIFHDRSIGIIYTDAQFYASYRLWINSNKGTYTSAKHAVNIDEFCSILRKEFYKLFGQTEDGDGFIVLLGKVRMQKQFCNSLLLTRGDVFDGKKNKK